MNTTIKNDYYRFLCLINNYILYGNDSDEDTIKTILYWAEEKKKVLEGIIKNG